MDFRCRICLSYVISSLLISAFIYSMVGQNIQNKNTLIRLREEVDELTHLALQNSGVPGDGQPRYLTEVIEGIVRKKLAAIWDDLYAVKKQLRATECSMGNRGQPQIGSVSNKIARINFASEQLGARICSVNAEPACGTNFLKALLGLDYESNPPINMLRESMHPGNCFTFKHDKAEVVVKLAKNIIIDTIEMEHIPATLSPTSETKNAPKVFKVFGIGNEKKEVLLGSFIYENCPTNRIQQYDVNCACKYDHVRFKFESNHGNPNFTSIYRVAVYGKL